MRFADKCLLIGIGAQKAGTSWMAQYFASHPQVYMASLKELHYFDARFAPQQSTRFELEFIRRLSAVAGEVRTGADLRRRRSLLSDLTDRVSMIFHGEKYCDYFEDRIRDETAFCEITPAYSILAADAYEAMARVHDRVRFIFILRDPLDRLWSALKFDSIPRPDTDPSNYQTAFSDPNFVARSDYQRTITELEKAVGREDILYVFYEDIFGESAIRRICNFINVDYAEAEFSERINATAEVTPPESYEADAFAHLRGVYEFVASRFTSELPERWKLRLQQYA